MTATRDDKGLWGLLDPSVLASIVVVSPHFDDAALGAAHLLTSHPGSTVITVLGGRPPSYPEIVTSWDAAGGFRSGDDVVGARREEDRAAMASMKATPVWLDFPDHQYLTADGRPTPAEVAPPLRQAIVAHRSQCGVPAHGAGQPRSRVDPRRRSAGPSDPGRRRERSELVLLRGRRLQASPRPPGLADLEALPQWPVAHPGRRPGANRTCRPSERPSGSTPARWPRWSATTCCPSAWTPTCPSRTGGWPLRRRAGNA